MGNKVIVTRGTRLNLVSKESYYLSCKGCAIEADGTATVVDSNGNSFYIEPRRMHSHLWGDYRLIYPMETLEDVAKWVSGGRKLEDLQGDSKSEWTTISNLGFGQYGEVVSWEGTTMKGRVILRADTKYAAFIDILTGGRWLEGTEEFRSVHDNDSIMVWPVRFDLGDTITITGE